MVWCLTCVRVVQMVRLIRGADVFAEGPRKRNVPIADCNPRHQLSLIFCRAVKTTSHLSNRVSLYVPQRTGQTMRTDRNMQAGHLVIFNITKSCSTAPFRRGGYSMNEGQQSTHSTCTGVLLACMGNILISSRAERHTRTPRAVVRRRTQLFSSCSALRSARP